MLSSSIVYALQASYYKLTSRASTGGLLGPRPSLSGQATPGCLKFECSLRAYSRMSGTAAVVGRFLTRALRLNRNVAVEPRMQFRSIRLSLPQLAVDPTVRLQQGCFGSLHWRRTRRIATLGTCDASHVVNRDIELHWFAGQPSGKLFIARLELFECIVRCPCMPFWRRTNDAGINIDQLWRCSM